MAPAVASEEVELSDGEVFDIHIAPVAKRLGDATVRMLAYNGSIRRTPGNPEWIAERRRIISYIDAPADKTLALVAEMDPGTHPHGHNHESDRAEDSAESGWDAPHGETDLGTTSPGDVEQRDVADIEWEDEMTDMNRMTTQPIGIGSNVDLGLEPGQRPDPA